MTKTFTAAMKEFFGLLPGQTTLDFGKELKALSHDEKLYFAHHLRNAGVDCLDPTAPATA